MDDTYCYRIFFRVRWDGRVGGRVPGDGCHTYMERGLERRKGERWWRWPLASCKSFVNSWYKLATKKKKLGPLALAHP
jgi:hypothetical protein